MNRVMEVIKSRRSTRKFTDQPVEREKIDMILEAGTWAPSANNMQSWHFTVVQDGQLIKKMSDVSKENALTSKVEAERKMASNKDLDLFYGAKTVIVVSASEESEDAITDISAATQNMLLAAESLGLGSCWNGMKYLFNYLPEHEVLKELQLPEGVKPYYSVPIGYKAFEGKAPKRKEGNIQYL